MGWSLLNLIYKLAYLIFPLEYPDLKKLAHNRSNSSQEDPRLKKQWISAPEVMMQYDACPTSSG